MHHSPAVIITRLRHLLQRLRTEAYRPLAPLHLEAWLTPEPVPFDHRSDGRSQRLELGRSWGRLWDCAWVRVSGRVPEDEIGQDLVLRLDLNGEALVCDGTGRPVCGLTNTASIFHRPLGEPGKTVVALADLGCGPEIEAWLDVGANDLFGTLQDQGAVRLADLCRRDRAMIALGYDLEVLVSLYEALPADRARSKRLLQIMTETERLLTRLDPATIATARQWLAPMLARRGGDPSLTVSALGHAHLDLAWLWPIRETRRKNVRTFATVLNHMPRHPDYLFGCSQAQLFAWLEEDQPDLFAAVRDRIADGRIEPLGCMWVEPDINLPSGESLIRQIAHGLDYYDRTFGHRPRHCFVPDCFGYSCSLPQILAGCGIDSFLTQKLSWSTTNVHPHHSFCWRGNDGSQVLAHLFPSDTYNSPQTPAHILKSERNYIDAGVSSHLMTYFGIGDGGGGPGEEHLERLARIGNLDGLPPVVQRRTEAFLADWSRESAAFATHSGELYLERHQGTLTTRGEVKRGNAMMEEGLRGLECWAALARIHAGHAYPRAALHRLWQETLLYQFHDVLPGSSINRVYDECLPRYQAMAAEIEDLTGQARTALASLVDTSAARGPLVVWNDSAWSRQEWLAHHGRWYAVRVPAMGHVVIDADAPASPPAPHAQTHRLANDLVELHIDDQGRISSLRHLGQELVRPGYLLNDLRVYTDDGDAWDFPPDYHQRPYRSLQRVTVEVLVDGPEARLRQRFVDGDSVLEQDLVLTMGSARITFVTRFDWHSPRTMLRTSFATVHQAPEARCGVQFGSITRPTHDNTSWQIAQNDVCAQRWVDLHAGHSGIAVLSGSKYGHRLKDSIIDLALLRCVPVPNEDHVIDADGQRVANPRGWTDLGSHSCTYAIYPHVGDEIEGGVIQAANDLCRPLALTPCQPHDGPLPAHHSFIDCPDPAIDITAVKLAEDGDDVIIRSCNNARQPRTTAITCSWKPTRARATNLLEQEPQDLTICDGRLVREHRMHGVCTTRLGRA